MRRLLALLAVALVVLSCARAAPAAPSETSSARPSIGAPPPTAATTSPSTAPSDARVLIQMGEHFFDPPLVTIPVGATVVWRVVGQQAHDVHARDGSFNSPLLFPGGTFEVTFTRPGRYAYYCAPHEGDGMIGTIEVR